MSWAGVQRKEKATLSKERLGWPGVETETDSKDKQATNMPW